MSDQRTERRVVIAGPVHPALTSRLQESCTLRVWDDAKHAIPHATLMEWLQDADAFVPHGGIQVDGSLLAKAPRLRVIAQSAVGYDNVDVKACKAKGVPFANTPGVLVNATADLTFALVLLVMRRLVEAVDHVRSGRFAHGEAMPYGHDLALKTLGIIGMGDIGSAVAKRALASDMHVMYHNRSRRMGDQQLGAVYGTLSEVLAQSDCIVVLTPLTEHTRGLFGAAQFAQMKRSAFFVNAARGQVVDTAALVAVLQEGVIAGAALDVTDPEPLPAEHPLLHMKNVIVTPHIGSATHETREAMALLTADNILRGLDGLPLLTEVFM
ncbi:MAG: D-glycerate dehydrogenase [Firmicutes bacterium]|nr:D-glycerate dehydrogenase [Bacillota bacterium]